MSLWGKIKRGTEKAKRKAEDAAREAKHETEKAVEEAKRQSEKLAKKAVDEAERKLIVGVIDDVRKLADGAKHKIDDAVNSGMRDIKRAADEVPGRIDTAITEQLPKAMKEAFAKQLPRIITQEIPKVAVQVIKDTPDEFHKFAGELQQALTGPGLRTAKLLIQATYRELEKATQAEPELVADLDAIGLGIRLGLVKASFSKGYARMDLIVGVLDRYIENPPKFRRRDVRDFLTALGPNSLRFVGSAKANIVIFGSSLMEIETDISGIPFRLGIRAVDAVLETAGVPE